MHIVFNLSLDKETGEMLNQQAMTLHLSKSALVRLLLVKNQKVVCK